MSSKQLRSEERYAVIGPTYPFKGGISHFTTILVKQLRQAGDVDFITWKRQYPGFLYPVDQKDTASKQVVKADALSLLDFYNPFTWVRTARRVMKVRPSELILTWVTPVQAPIYVTIAWLVRRMSPTRVVLLCHNALPHERKFYDTPLSRLMFKNCDRFIVHSEDDRGEVAQYAGDKQITKAFHPVFDEFNTGRAYDVDLIKSQLRLRNKVLLFFGYIRPYKGLKYLIEAMPAIKAAHPDVSLLVVGEFWSKDKPEYVGLVNDLGLQDDVVFVDHYVPNEEVGKYFAVCNALVAPYVSASQSGVIQMAYAFDKPVVATRVGGLSEVVQEGVTGLLVTPKSSEAIAVGSLRALDMPLSGTVDAKRRFGWANYADLLQAGQS